MKDEPRFMVIPAAGLGTRMRSVDPGLPKEMLQVGKKPAIQYAVEEAHSAGIREIIIIIHKNKEIIRHYFEDGGYRKRMFPSADQNSEKMFRACSFKFLYQDEPRGEADAIILARDLVGDHAFALFYPDNVYFPAPGALQILRSIYRRFKTDVVALMQVGQKDAEGFSDSGRVDITPMEDKIYRIVKFHPKGKGTFVPRFKGELRTCGMAITGPHIFSYIDMAREKDKGRELTDGPIRRLMIKERMVVGCRLPGRLFDVGNPRGYSLCLEYILSNDEVQ